MGRKTKAQLIERLQTERKRLEQNLARLTPEQMVQPGVVAIWSVKDVLAHLATWETLCLGWLNTSQQGDTPAVPAAGFTWKTIDALNQQIYEEQRDQPLSAVLNEFHAVHQRLIECVQGLSDEELFTPSHFRWTGKRAFADWVGFYGAHDLWGKTRIRQWMKETLKMKV